MTTTTRVPRGEARRRILEAALDVIRAKGYAATSVDDLCAAAGVTKGAFFHHFASKEALGVAAAEHWGEVTGALFAAADFHERATAAERVLAYLDLRSALVGGGPAAYTCLAGTMVQETFATHPAVRDACAVVIFDHAATLEADIAQALADAGRTDQDPGDLAQHTQAVIQGSFVLAKASGDAGMVTRSIAHLRDYLATLFTPGHATPATSASSGTDGSSAARRR